MDEELSRLKKEVADLQESFEKKAEELASVYASLKRASLVLKDFDKRYKDKVIHKLRELEEDGGLEYIPSDKEGGTEEELDFSLFDNLEWVASLGMSTSEAL